MNIFIPKRSEHRVDKKEFSTIQFRLAAANKMKTGFGIVG